MPYLSPAEPAPAATQTALIVPVPAADALVGELREALDPAAGWGVPAHVTVLFPFVPPEQVDDELVATLAGVLSAVGAFGSPPTGGRPERSGVTTCAARDRRWISSRTAQV